MESYPKIHSVYKRDNQTNSLINNEFSLPEFEYLKNNIWTFTEKVDGTNIRIIWQDNKILFKGRTDKAQIPTPLIDHLRDTFLPLQDKFYNLFKDNVCLYGEGYGAKIQKGGGNYRDDQSFVLFDIKIGNWWLQRDDIFNIAEKLGIDTVPNVGCGTLYDAIDIVKNGLVSKWGDFLAEGIVARPKIELRARNGKRIITKVKYRDFKDEG